MQQKTAAVLVVNEDVSKLEDGNIQFVSEQLHNLNYNVEKTAVILYKESTIAPELEECIKRSDIVVLIGGICSLYSNLILRVVAKIFHQSLIYNSKLHCGNGDGYIPMHAKVLEHAKGIAVYLQGVIMLPNSVELVKSSFSNVVMPFLKNFNKKLMFKRALIIRCDTNVNFMHRMPNKEHVDVRCVIMENEVKVTLMSTSMSMLFNYEESLKNIYGDKIMECIEGSNIDKLVYNQIHYSYIRNSIETIEECFAKYGPENVFLSFNGGKDCTVLLHLALGVLKKNYPSYKKKLFCIYVESPHPFVELNTFVTQCEWYYDLNILKLNKTIKESLEYVLKAMPSMKACLMGTRRTDPFSEGLKSFQMTDVGWPQVIRVSPLLDWHYSEIWDYLLNLKVPYCSLYDLGYTSIGNRSNSVSNPALAINDTLKGCTTYLPAYKLLNASCERNGRKLA